MYVPCTTATHLIESTARNLVGSSSQKSVDLTSAGYHWRRLHHLVAESSTSNSCLDQFCRWCFQAFPYPTEPFLFPLSTNLISSARKGWLDIVQGLGSRHLPFNWFKGMNNYLSIFKFFAFVLFLCFRGFKPAKQNHNKDSSQWHSWADSSQLQSKNSIFLHPFTPRSEQYFNYSNNLHQN